MSQLLMRQALEKRLAALDSTKTVYEGTGDSPPTDSETPYQQTYFMPATPLNDVQGQKSFCEIGIFQVTLRWPGGRGPGDCAAQAEAVRQQFKRGTTLTQGVINVLITHTPAIAKGAEVDGRWVVPVSIRWQAWVTVA